ncbi:hypothetical protein C427_4781 [Paraglaciecola psychrophila 170]|uniref:Uncharacterized protein n=1 Tax=Paraglaciecola psychrophila 170 TaxID=1129794 RepID=K7A586_9ALTE|nr:hypothetical protein C427_4781 [Paraglaciecola psychrophila 170]GAC36008.1 hypothetical protein GPSY_0366 [Paraglaciecola psychrophila 170]
MRDIFSFRFIPSPSARSISLFHFKKLKLIPKQLCLDCGK